MSELNEEQYARLQEPLEDETDEQKKLGSDYIKTTLLTSYVDTPRNSSAGPIMVNNSLRLNESIYSLAYVYLLKRIHIEGDLSTDEERDAMDDGLKQDAQQ